MRLFGREKTVSAPERRNAPRVRVDCMAVLVMPSGNIAGRLFDISDAGARITAENPPGKGCSAILEWPWGEAFCRITWTKPGMCGVEFDRPLLARVLQETIESAPAGLRLIYSADPACTGTGTDPGAHGSNPHNPSTARPRLFC